MARESRVRAIFFEELQTRAPEPLKEAGEKWQVKEMGFYFPEDEGVVDLCALAVLNRALREDGTTVSNGVKQRALSMINTDTVVKDAITIIHFITLTPGRRK